MTIEAPVEEHKRVASTDVSLELGSHIGAHRTSPLSIRWSGTVPIAAASLVASVRRYAVGCPDLRVQVAACRSWHEQPTYTTPENRGAPVTLTTAVVNAYASSATKQLPVGYRTSILQEMGDFD